MNVTRRVALGGLAALAAGPHIAAAQSVTEMTIGTPPNDSAGPLLYAADLRAYERAGLRVTLTVLNNPGPVTAALASGSLTVAGIPISVAALARERGIPLTMIAPLSVYLNTTPTNALIVAKSSPLQRAADLNGKTIATRDLNNMSFFGARAWIDKNGGDSSTVHWVEIPDTQHVAALQAGRCDATSISEPAFDEALRGGTIRVLGPVFDAIANRFLVAGCFTTEAYAQANPQTVRNFADVIATTARWANQPANRTASGAILSKYAQAPVAPGSTRVSYAERMRAADVQPVLDLLLTYKLLKAPMRATDLFSPVVSA